MDRKALLESLRRNVCVLFTDLKGSTSYFEKYGDAAGLMMVHRSTTMLSLAVERHAGRVIKTIGDSVMAVYEDPLEAIASSIEMQEAIDADNKDKEESRRVSVRIGINYGLGLVKSNDVFGDVVNVASRVESAAAPEQILVSDTLFAALKGSERFKIRPMGKFALKGKADERDLFEIVWRQGGDTVPAGSHSMIAVPSFAPGVSYKLTQVRVDGRPGRELNINADSCIIGRSGCEFTFPNDQTMEPAHARVTIDSGQLFVEPINQATVFFSLVGPYRLQNGDVVKMGGQVLEFHANAAVLEMASASSMATKDVSAKLQKPIAEMVSVTDQRRFPLGEGDTTFGRTKGTHIFADTSMSRSHAKINHRGEDFFIEDTGSTNGTFVKAHEKTPLPENVTVSIAGQLLRVSREAGEQPAAGRPA
jgi:class 3 adenylate cyclase/pSer/pThr/pTyr-binding forkhead associated (FHA) protein